MEQKENVNELNHNSLWVPYISESTLSLYCRGQNSYFPTGPSRCTSKGLNQEVSSAARERGQDLPRAFSGESACENTKSGLKDSNQ